MNWMFMKLLGTISLVSANCPAFECNVDNGKDDTDMNSTGICFKHSADDPVTKIKV